MTCADRAAHPAASRTAFDDRSGVTTSVPLRRGGHASASIAGKRTGAQGYRLPARSTASGKLTERSGRLMGRSAARAQLHRVITGMRCETIHTAPFKAWPFSRLAAGAELE